MTHEESRAISQIASAFSGALVCGFDIDQKRAAEFLSTKSLAGTHFDQTNIAEAMFTVVGVAEFQANIQGYKSFLGFGRMKQNEFVGYCSEMLASFGSSGTSVPGLVSLPKKP